MKQPDNLDYITTQTLPMLPTSERFAIGLTGTALEPRYRNGAELVIDPTAKVAPGCTVIASIPGKPRPTVMFLNADGDLFDFEGGYYALGRWRLVGVVVGTQN